MNTSKRKTLVFGAPAGHTGAARSDQRPAVVDLSDHGRLALGAGNQAQPSLRLCRGIASLIPRPARANR